MSDIEALLDGDNVIGRYDVCVVGSGPVGTSLAIALARRGREVVIVEAGTERPTQENQLRLNAVAGTAQNHKPLDVAACRALGGTSFYWGGRCTPLDPVDFTPSRSADHAEWPIDFLELDDYHREAFELLGCPPPTEEASASIRFPGLAGVRLDSPELWCDQPYVGKRLRRVAASTGRIKIVTNCLVVGLEFSDGNGRVSGLVTKHMGRPKTLRPGCQIVLACGGLETARLLLNVQRRNPNLFGGANGPLGRHYQGHISGSIASIRFHSAELRRHFDYNRVDRAFQRWRMRLPDEDFYEKALLNIAFWPDNPPMGRSDHENGLLSLIHLLLRSPFGARLLPPAIRQAQLQGADSIRSHVWNSLTDPIGVAFGGMRLAWQKFVLGRRHPLIFSHSRNGVYPLHFHAEQSAGHENRVSLSDEADDTGYFRLRIDYEVSKSDAENCLESHKLLKALLEKSGLADVELLGDADAVQTILTNSIDGFHQIGTTRMSDSPETGVVNRDCQVFDMDNLFIVGSSVFPSSGQANPTLSASALAVRLADKLSHRLKSRSLPVETPNK